MFHHTGEMVIHILTPPEFILLCLHPPCVPPHPPQKFSFSWYFALNTLLYITRQMCYCLYNLFNSNNFILKQNVVSSASQSLWY